MSQNQAQSSTGTGRVLVWFSCGAASAVASKLAVEDYGDSVEVLYCNTLAYEHPDNVRFMSDVSRWIGKEIKLLNSNKFKDVMEVWEKERFLNSRFGAPCTRALKRNVRIAYQRPGDIHVFGFTAEEQDRADGFHKDNPDIDTYLPLIERGYTKASCFKVINDAGIEIPAMYKLGYRNNNCIGCVKGGAGYWNKIRQDFPDHFNRMAALERKLGYRLLRNWYLDELPLNVGRYKGEDISCGVVCVSPQTELNLNEH